MLGQPTIRTVIAALAVLSFGLAVMNTFRAYYLLTTLGASPTAFGVIMGVGGAGSLAGALLAGEDHGPVRCRPGDHHRVRGQPTRPGAAAPGRARPLLAAHPGRLALSARLHDAVLAAVVELAQHRGNGPVCDAVFVPGR